MSRIRLEELRRAIWLLVQRSHGARTTPRRLHGAASPRAGLACHILAPSPGHNGRRNHEDHPTIPRLDAGVEIAHEALLMHWGQLKTWRNHDREGQRVQVDLRGAVRLG